MLAVRRGLGPEELRLARPVFLEAVRWALFAEKLAPDLAELRSTIATDPPDSLVGAERVRFMNRRTAAREELAERIALLYPEDSDG